MIIRTLRGVPRRKAGVVALAVLTFGILVTLAALTTPPKGPEVDPSVSTPGTPGTSSATTTNQSSVSTDRTPPAATDRPIMVRQSEPARSFSPLRYALTVLLLAAAAGAAYYMRSRRRDKPAGSAITLIDRHPIRQGQEIRLLRIGDSEVLVGVCPNQITLLSERSVAASESDPAGSAASSTEAAAPPASARFEKALAAARAVTVDRTTFSPVASGQPAKTAAVGKSAEPGVYPTPEMPVGSTIGVVTNPSAVRRNHA